MELQKFIQNFADQFGDIDVSDLTVDTKFKKLDEWTSLVSLSIIAMIDEEYEVTINGNDIRSSDTIGDLFGIVKSRKNV